VSLAPGAPRNPDLIVGDTDALIQLIACDTLGPLKILRGEYGIRTVVLEAVEIELRSLTRTQKFRDVEHILTKALNSKLLEILDENAAQSISGNAALLTEIDTLASDFQRLGVGRGEAYTHAAGKKLLAPILSNDSNAIKVLHANGVSLPGPFLRSFDVIVFGLQIGNLSTQDCDGARQSLVGRGEGVGSCFTGTSFEKGLPAFHQRLIDARLGAVGAASPQHPFDHNKIFIRSVK
jgi:hypothetical protein